MMKISGQLQAEIFKAVLTTIVAGGVIYFGKKFIDQVVAKAQSVADIPGQVLDTVTEAVDTAVIATKTAVGTATAKATENASKGLLPTQPSTAKFPYAPAIPQTAVIGGGLYVGQKMAQSIVDWFKPTTNTPSASTLKNAMQTDMRGTGFDF